jgi:hypothetical protein
MMGHWLVFASIDRAGGHIVIVGALVGIAAAGGLIYALVHRANKNRAARTRSESAQGPEA